jgi:hypothetical protein
VPHAPGHPTATLASRRCTGVWRQLQRLGLQAAPAQGAVLPGEAWASVASSPMTTMVDPASLSPRGEWPALHIAWRDAFQAPRHMRSDGADVAHPCMTSPGAPLLLTAVAARRCSHCFRCAHTHGRFSREPVKFECYRPWRYSD